MKRAFLVCAALAVSSTAAAGQDDSRADALFEAGLKLLDDGRIAEACDRLNESRKIANGIGVTLYLADCEERIGHWVKAADLYREGQAMAEAKKDSRAQNARERADSLANRIPMLRVHVDGSTIPAIEVDGETSDTSAHEIDPGRHVVRARTKDRTWEHAIDVPAQKTTVDVEVPSFDVETTKPAAAPFFTPLRIGGIASAGVGVVLWTFSFALGADAITKMNASKTDNHCDSTNHCDMTGLSLRSGADSEAGASTGLFIVGMIAIAAGAALVFVAPKIFTPKTGASGVGLTF